MEPGLEKGWLEKVDGVCCEDCWTPLFYTFLGKRQRILVFCQLCRSEGREMMDSAADID